jgi:hypothetical protein
MPRILPLGEDLALRTKVRRPECAAGMLQTRQYIARQMIEIQVLDGTENLAQQETVARRRPVQRQDGTLEVGEREIRALICVRVPEERPCEAAPVGGCQQAAVTSQR